MIRLYGCTHNHKVHPYLLVWLLPCISRMGLLSTCIDKRQKKVVSRFTFIWYTVYTKLVRKFRGRVLCGRMKNRCLYCYLYIVIVITIIIFFIIIIVGLLCFSASYLICLVNLNKIIIVRFIESFNAQVL